MAKKGQKFKQTAIEIKNKAINDCLKRNLSVRFVGKKYGISHNTIMTWIRKYRRDMTLEPIKKRGRPISDKNLSELEKLKVENEILKKYQAFLKVQPEEK